MPLERFLEEIAGQEALAGALDRVVAPGGGRVQLAPLLASARAALVAAMARRARGPLLLLVANGEAALRVREDLCTWLDGDEVLLFPASDAMPYEAMSPGDEVIAQRLRVLRRLAAWQPAAIEDKPPLGPLVVAPIRALMQPTLTPEELRRASLDLAQGQRRAEEDLLRGLLNLGYRAAATVETPGEVSRRGGILDLWSPGDDLPLRVEFFGDEIDSLRRFEPLSQRSEQRVPEARLGPPHEFPLWRLEQALARLEAVDISELRRESQDEWRLALERLAHGERFEGRALFAPFFRERHGTLLDHLPARALIALSEARALRQVVEELHGQAQELRENLVRGAELSPAFPRPYLVWDEIFAIEAARVTLVDLAGAPEAELGAVEPPLSLIHI